MPLITAAGTQYNSYVQGDFRRTSNSWTIPRYIHRPGRNRAWVTPIMLDANVNTTIYAGYNEVYKSINQGGTYAAISSFGGSTIRSLAVTPASSNVICAATQSALYRTTNGGSNWTNITGSLPTGSGSITYVWIKDNDAVIPFGFHLAVTIRLEFLSRPMGGTSWTNISVALPALPVMCNSK
ncbi:MAG: hypothetical protein R2750_04200 [Bacteroidales bacterium]